MALIASRLHLVWIATVCGKLKTDFRYSNTLGWNTFPVPTLTEKNKADLTRCAEDILLAREAHFPATIADLYDPEKMPDDLRAAHERNDEVLERIYIGRRFRNDTERLEKLFELYTKMTARGLRRRPRQERKHERMTEQSKSVPSVSVTYARNGSSTKSNELGMRADAGARLREARRAVSADQVAAGLGQEPRADVHRARQAAQPGPQAGDHRRAGEVHRRRASTTSRCSKFGFWADWTVAAEVEPVQRARRRTAARSSRSGRSWTATTRCWSAPMPPSALPWTSSASRRSTTG